MGKVIDLSDLVEDLVFKVKEDEYHIPPMNDARIKEIMQIGNEINAITKDVDEKNLEKNTDYLDKQNQILSKSVLKKDGSSITEEDFRSWPVKLKSKVVELVFNHISISAGEGITVEQEKN